MNIYRLLTDEEIKLSNQNNRKARNWFRRNGYMPDTSLTYDLHHKDPNLRYTDLQRYIQWNISDLICIEHSEHSRLHGFLENRSFADRSSTTKQMWEDENSYVNSTEYKNLISEIVRKNHAKKDSPYGDEWKHRISESCTEWWSSERRAAQSQNVAAKWKDPNHAYNSAAFRERRAKSHMKKIIIENESIKIVFNSEYECGLALGYSTKEKATNMVGWMIKHRGYVTARKSIYRGWKIYREDVMNE